MKTIKDLPEHSRAREKLQEKGASALTDEELVAAILGMGTNSLAAICSRTPSRSWLPRMFCRSCQEAGLIP